MLLYSLIEFVGLFDVVHGVAESVAPSFFDSDFDIQLASKFAFVLLILLCCYCLSFLEGTSIDLPHFHSADVKPETSMPYNR